MRLSIIIPVYNEEKTLANIVRKVEKAKLPKHNGKEIEKEIILVDDCSTDGSRKILLKLKRKHKVFFHKKNTGKGGALKTGFTKATGDIMVVQDADLEYDPNDFGKLIMPILKGQHQVVYGSRFKSSKGNLKKNMHLTYLLHSFGNKMLTIMTNVLFFSRLTDMETCYKMFTKEAFKSIGNLRANRFDFEPEITTKFLKKGYKIKEIPIKYYSRDFSEGKKITWKDGVKAAYYLLKYRFSS